MPGIIIEYTACGKGNCTSFGSIVTLHYGSNTISEEQEKYLIDNGVIKPKPKKIKDKEIE